MTSAKIYVPRVVNNEKLGIYYQVNVKSSILAPIIRNIRSSKKKSQKKGDQNLPYSLKTVK